MCVLPRLSGFVPSYDEDFFEAGGIPEPMAVLHPERLRAILEDKCAAVVQYSLHCFCCFVCKESGLFVSFEAILRSPFPRQ